MSARFGDFTLDLEARQLWHGAVETHLSPKAFDLLAALVEAHPRALSKDELYQRIWGETFVTEGNLSVLVTEIRHALDDDARAPRYVRTVPRFGYAFAAPVDGPLAAAAPEAAGSGHWLTWGSRKVELPAGAAVIGRDPHCEVHLDVPGVSRQHARIRVSGTLATIEDLGSKNGTSRSGQTLSGVVELHDRDRIEIGSVSLLYRYWPGPETTASLPGRPAS